MTLYRLAGGVKFDKVVVTAYSPAIHKDLRHRFTAAAHLNKPVTRGIIASDVDFLKFNLF